MQIRISLKNLGKRKPYIDQKSIDLPGDFSQPKPLREILAAVVTGEVLSFNARKEEKGLISFLDNAQIESQAKEGKVTFGEVYNDQQADLDLAIKRVLLAFEDGIIAVFVGDDQVESLEEIVPLVPGLSLTFVRLTFLAGSYF